MNSNVRLSERGLRVLRHLLERPRDPCAGAEIARATGVTSGTLYPLLQRLESAGWLGSEWEDIDPREAGRPRMRFYKLTAVGRRQAQEKLAGLQL